VPFGGMLVLIEVAVLELVVDQDVPLVDDCKK
jgi:hypothetical protein